MKQFPRLFFVVVFILMIGISACAPKTDTAVMSQVNATETNELAQAETPFADLQATETAPLETKTIDVETLILEKLQNNHSIDRVLAAQKTREEWNTTLDRMIGYGAKINEEEKKIIIDYLLSR
ncbi:MAG: hypothetical protein CVU42_08785 [Chloroflexi bacterium HGW-Chloroflexi-4]|jgi:hypothetical protein|nr:MAG: hypothetical protein CVU42_08785 [Chloroflexi bacterium HGW-Chloroflexi-4]